MKNIIILVLLLLVGAGAYYFYITLKDTEPVADIAFQAQQYCSQENVAQVEISRSAGFVKVTSTLLGGGSAYYAENDITPLQCPVVAPDSMSDECKALIAITDWVMICENAVTPPIATPTNEEAELTGFNFILDAIMVISTTSPETVTVERAVSALSTNAASKVSKEKIAEDLATFLGIETVPEQGASVENLEVNGEQAKLVVGLNFSTGRELRNVNLVVENGMWKVDTVTVATEVTGSFDHTGNLVFNNPGMENDVWYLVYEAPGEPALSMKLQFDEQSVCSEGVCNPETLKAGQSVRVVGEVLGTSTVQVLQLEIK